MDTLDLLEALLADYDGTLILVSHDRDFIDRLATSTIGLDGRGNAAESPGGWSDFNRQHPDFFRGSASALPSVATSSAGTGGGRPPEPRRLAKLSYKDQRRLEELDRLIASLPAEIDRLEAIVADPGLYRSDPGAFNAAMMAMDVARTDLAAAESDWLALEEKRETTA